MRIGLVARREDADRVGLAREVVEHLHSRAEVVVKDELAPLFPDLKALALKDMDVDVLATVGGDGTILYAMQQSTAPVLGINMGDLGFLTEVEPARVRECLDALLRGEYTVEERLKLAVALNGQRLPDAVNEAVIKTAHPSKMLTLEVVSDAQRIDELRADGVIVATPTGSTSYGMSAGGPIVDPRIEAFILVPLAAFKLGARPFVFPAEATLEVRLPGGAKDAVLVLDGQLERGLAGGDRVEFTGSQRRARFVRVRGGGLVQGFYARLRERLVR